TLLLVGGHIKVADFGLVKSVHDASVSIVAGLTPMFAAPETFDGRPSDRSDQYSLAIVYQLLLTGRCPFNGQTLAQLASQHLNARPCLDSLPESDRACIERALSKDPFDRFPNCRSLVERLRGQNSGSVGTARAANPPAPPPVRTAPRTAPRPPTSPATPEFKTEVLDVGGEASDSPSEEDTRRLTTSLRGTVIDLPPLELGSPESLQPTLFLGVGGCGAKALRALGRRWQARLGDLGSIPSFAQLLIDTDAQGYESHFVASSVGTLDDRHFLHTPLHPTAYYRSRADELTRWLSRRWIYNIPKSLKTDGARPLGRLALVDHATAIDRRLSEQLAAICDPAAVAATQAKLGKPVDAHRPRVVILGSLSSGTGGGMIWDLAQMAYQAHPSMEGSRLEVLFALAHWSFPTATELELARVNTCASLRELQHYATEGCPGDPSCHLPALGRHYGLFDRVYLVNFGALGRDEAFDAAADSLAEYIEINVLSNAREFLSKCRQAGTTDHRDSATVRTFAVARLTNDDLSAADQAGRHLVKSAFRSCVESILQGGATFDPHRTTPGSGTSESPVPEPTTANLSDTAVALLDAGVQSSLKSEIDGIMEQDLREVLSGPAAALGGASLTASLSKRSLSTARRWMLDELVRQKVTAIQPSLLICGGVRRFLIMASRALQQSGLVERVQQQLPAEATVVDHDTDEILLLCEAQDVPANIIALNLTQDRPDLLELASRMPTRCDVSWAAF
ncbi:MAG: tubulin-like doman-containing protein, partial [Pirellulaceae bacterium]